MDELPYLTADLPGIGGQIKQRVEDFQVQEVPLYLPSGSGTHMYFRMTKRGISTPAAIERLARHMGTSAEEFGLAGLKDAQALTSQYISLEHADAQKLSRFHDAQVQVEPAGYHGNKLRPGHLLGNRFHIRIRGVGGEGLPQAGAVLDVLTRRGVPNFYGPQRFGARGDTARLGELLVRNDLAEFLAIFLGRCVPSDGPDCKAARDAFDAGFFGRALDRWPRHYANERRALSAFKKRQHPGPAVAAIDKRMRRLYVSAFQSLIFNQVLAERLGTMDRVFRGDLAQKTDSGGVFEVMDEAIEQPRADRFEISPTGPIIGLRCNLAGENPGGQVDPGRIERDVLARHNVQAEDFRHVGALKVKGTRRALRFKIEQPELGASKDDVGEFLELSFQAPSGCYATVVLREIMKSPVATES